jgi:hypothetical protein
MKIIITETQLKSIIGESFKLTFEDKKNIDNLIRTIYEDEILKNQKEYERLKKELEIQKSAFNYIQNAPESAYIDDPYLENAKKITLSSITYLEQWLKHYKLNKEQRYNKFYIDNYDRIKKNYINRERSNPKRRKKYNIPDPDLTFNKIDSEIVEKIKNGLTNNEKNSIKKFLEIVAIRQDSATGESISKKRVRDSFFKTPEIFQRLYSVKPSKWFWRGDDYHPCDEEYKMSKYNKYLQSFSQNKKGARFFGDIRFSAINIKKYGGSFSLPKYVSNEMFDSDIGDDEGEIMFFDVEYGCKKKYRMYE